MNAKSLVVVLLVAGLAAAAWFLFSGGDGPELDPAPTANEVVDRSGDDPATGSGNIAPNPASPAAGEPAAGEPEAAAGSAVDREAVAAAEAAGRDATASIRGRLVDLDGNPIQGGKLSRSEVGNPERSEFVGTINGRDLPGHELTTDGDGRFRFELARDRTAMLGLPGDDHVFVEQPPMIHGFKGDRDLGDLVVATSAVVTGVVQDEAGNPVADVKVSAGHGLLGFMTSTGAPTDERGRFRVGKLRPGNWTLRTASARHMPTSEKIELTAGATLENVVLVVRSGSAVSGQVVDDLGRPVPDMKVVAKRVETNAGVEVERFATDEAAVTDQNGFFTLAGIGDETTSVRASGPGHSTAVQTGVKVGTGDLLLRVDRLATISGVLRGADGAPIADSRVRAIAEGSDTMLASHGIEGMLADRSATARTGPDGSFRLVDVAPGTITVQATGKLHRPAKQAGVRVAPAQSVQGVQLVAERGAVVSLTVVDDAGKPVAGAKVAAKRPPADDGPGGFSMRSRRVEDDDDEIRVFGGDDAIAKAETGADGIAVLAGLPAESVVFHAEHDDFAPARTVTLPLTRNGSTDLELTLRTPGFADLVVTDGNSVPVEGARWVVRGPLGASDSDDHRGRTDAEGKSLVGPLAAGNYVAELERAPSAQRFGGAMVSFSDGSSSAIAGSDQRFQVVAGKTAAVEIRQPVLTRVFGTVSGVDGPVGGAQVELAKADNGGGMPGMPPGMSTDSALSTTADSSGMFEIKDVERGRYTVRYGKSGQLVKAEVEIDVLPELPELRQDLVLSTGKVRIQAWNDQTGSPIEGAEVRLTRAQEGAGGQRQETRIMMVTMTRDGASGGDSTMMTIGGQTAKTDAEGWAEIEDVPVGKYDVRITHKKYTPGNRRGVEVAELQTADAGRLVMGQAGRVRGKVLGPDGKPARMALVFHRSVDAPPGPGGQPTMAMGGTFTIDALPTGRYMVRAQALDIGPGGQGSPGASSPEVEVEVKAGEAATVDLQLPEQ
ncbi:MAG: carboxypeptidase-like regulatory domain-containing protein [bacterium]|nr:carboxypeptidase-like regulatory domain-containing protein [bacterium]